jgi:hypothetical protein
VEVAVKDANAMTELLTTAPRIAACGRHHAVPSGREIKRAQQRKKQNETTQLNTKQRKGFA